MVKLVGFLIGVADVIVSWGNMPDLIAYLVGMIVGLAISLFPKKIADIQVETVMCWISILIAPILRTFGVEDSTAELVDNLFFFAWLVLLFLNSDDDNDSDRKFKIKKKKLEQTEIPGLLTQPI